MIISNQPLKVSEIDNAQSEKTSKSLKNIFSGKPINDSNLIKFENFKPSFNQLDFGLNNSPQSGTPVCINTKAELWKQNFILFYPEAELRGIINKNNSSQVSDGDISDKLAEN